MLRPRGSRVNTADLQIPVDNAIIVEIAESGHDFGAIEACARFREAFTHELHLLVKMVIQVAANCKLHHEAQAVVCLERVHQFLCVFGTICTSASGSLSSVFDYIRAFIN